MANPVLIILRHGSYSWFSQNMQGMPEGEPYEARILDANGNAIEVVYFGGADGVNKLLAGGHQQYLGNLTQIAAPPGTTVYDQSFNMWTSTGSGWKQQGGGSSAANIDCGSYW